MSNAPVHPSATPTETLLRAVVEASRHLAAEADLAKGMQSALDTLGSYTGLDRVYIIRYDHALQAGFCVADFCAPGVASLITTVGSGPYSYSDYEEVWKPLLAGQTYSSSTTLKTGANAALNRQLRTKSDLFVPIFVNETFWGSIGFDDCTTDRKYTSAEIAVLCGAAAALAAAIGRECAESARLASERARADETLALNHLLEGVVAASRSLLDEPDFKVGIQRWLASLAVALDADRAVMGNFAEGDDPANVAFSQVDYTKPGVKNVVSAPIPASTDFKVWGERLSRGETIWAHRSDLVDPISVRFYEECDCFTSLVMPIMVDQTTVGWMCFDWSTRKEWKSAYSTLLRTAADSAAAAFKRDETVRTSLAEREARAAVLATMNRELELRSRLLDAAARSSALLSASGDFGIAVIEAMGVVAEVAGFDRARIVEYVDASGNPDPRFFKVTSEWRRGEPPTLIEGDHDVGTHDEMPIFAAQILQRDSIVDYRVDELPDLATSARQRVMDARYYLAGSIWIDDRPWGAFSCDDYTTDRRRTDEEKGVIVAAARAIGQAIYRRCLDQRAEALQLQIVTEREQAANQRAAELARANDALGRSTASLVAESDITTFLCILMAETTTMTGAKSAAVFTYEDESEKLQMLAFMTGHRPVSISDDPLMEMWRQPVPLANTRLLISQLRNSRFASIDYATPAAGQLCPDTHCWHAKMGHRHVFIVPLYAGGKMIGTLGQCFPDGFVPSDFDYALTRILANHAALALQLLRLSEEAKISIAQAAVLKERNRIARDLHDTLAQGFTGVLAQLGAAEGAVENGDLAEASHYFERAKTLARFSLAEARSSVHALRPENNGSPLDARLRKMIETVTQGTALAAEVTESGEPAALGPAADWCVHKFVQETLANTLKHAQASLFRVELEWAAEFSAWVSDNGRGFDPATTVLGLGLQSMRERAMEVGGLFLNESLPGQGTRLCLRLPLPAFPAASVRS